jgi:natural product precursor
MKKFKTIKKLETSKLKKEQLTLITGGCTCGTYSACSADGSDEGDWPENQI